MINSSFYYCIMVRLSDFYKSNNNLSGKNSTNVARSMGKNIRFK